MNEKERFLKTISFEKTDRLPFMDFGYWPQTITKWHGEGLPTNIKTDDEVEKFLGLDVGFETNIINNWNTGSEIRVFPLFESKLLEEDEDNFIQINEQGVTEKCRKLGGAIPQYIDYPVKDMESFLKHKKFLDGKDALRLTDKAVSIGKEKIKNDEDVAMWIDGFLAWPREIMGIEELSYAYFEQPELIHAINQQHVQFIKDNASMVLERVGKIDYVCVFEDMAYKNSSLISPKMMREFMLPYYHEILSFLKGKGIKKAMVDSDGNTLDIVSIFKEAGFDAHYPCEIAAGNDPYKLREKEPKMALIGGFDKRAIIEGKHAIDKLITYLEPLVKSGGYIPSVDHRVPPDVSLDNYKYYLDKKFGLISRI